MNALRRWLNRIWSKPNTLDRLVDDVPPKKDDHPAEKEPRPDCPCEYCQHFDDCVHCHEFERWSGAQNSKPNTLDRLVDDKFLNMVQRYFSLF
jgi:hypothetical protein